MRGHPLPLASRAAAFAFASLLSLAAAGFASGCSDEAEPPADAADAGAEAAPDGQDAAPDAATDGGTDAADARPDAPSEAGATFCETLTPAPRFCDDFDDGDVDDDWAVRNVLGGSTLELDPASYASSPTSMHVTTKALDAAQSGPAHLRTTVTGAVSRVKLAFGVRIETNPAVTKGALALATLDVSASHFFTLYLRDAPQDGSEPAAILEEIDGATVRRHALTKLPAMGVWTRVTIDVDLGAGVASVLLGTEKALDAAVVSAIPGTEATIRVGAVYLFGPADAFEAGFDDVVVDF